MDSRYKEGESLLGLHVVEQVDAGDRDIKLYRITDFGKEIIESLRQSKDRL
jgi:predicted transcriptional regulator with HTH domain